jgi:hypothetical protein
LERHQRQRLEVIEGLPSEVEWSGSLGDGDDALDADAELAVLIIPEASEVTDERGRR